MLAGLIHNIGVLPILLKAEQWPELLQDTQLLDSIICELGTQIGVIILENWGFPASLVSVVAEHEDYQRDSIDGPDLIDIVQVANLQSQFNPRMIATDVDIAAVPSFRKLGIQTEVEVEELEENSADYAEALAFFGQR